jgi:hypothetical protein
MIGAGWLRAAALGAVLVCAAPAAGVAQQRPPARFPITSVGDSTIAFKSDARWVRRGQEGSVVDPARHDGLVAHFRVVSVLHGEAIALITGQMTDVTTDHVVLLDSPSTPWYRDRLFWLGLLFGGAAGAVAASQ